MSTYIANFEPSCYNPAMRSPENPLVGIVHPQPEVRNTLTSALEEKSVRTVSSGIRDFHPKDFINIDLGLVSEEAFNLNELFPNKPYIVLGEPKTETARQNRATAFIHTGAYDYIDTHENPRVVTLRILAALKRTVDSLQVPNNISHSGIDLYIAEREVFLNGNKLDIRTKEFEVLKAFMNNPGIALTRDQIFDLAWGQQYMSESRAVDVQVQSVRKLIGAEKIRSIIGVGYKFVGNEEE